jgi:hypothetical protein
MMVETEQVLETVDLRSAFDAAERGIFKVH